MNYQDSEQQTGLQDETASDSSHSHTAAAGESTGHQSVEPAYDGQDGETTSIRSVALKAKHIFPLLGRLMEVSRRDGQFVPTIHFHVLLMLENGPTTLGGLAEAQSVTSASLSRTITVLEERGWVRRVRSEEDRRQVTISITDAGRQVLADIERVGEDFLVDAFQRLSDDELNTLSAGMDILIDSFQEALQYYPIERNRPG